MKLNTKSVRIFADKHLENLGTTFQTLHGDEFLTDCTLYCKDGSIKAHRIILSLNSTYFRKIFSEHVNNNAIFVLYGVKHAQLRDLVELMYKGSIDVPTDHLDSVLDLAKEFQVTGISFEGPEKSPTIGTNRDTRFKGNKRVVTDFDIEPVPPVPPKNAKSSKQNDTDTTEQVQPSSSQNEQEVVQNGVSETANNRIQTENVASFNENMPNKASLSDTTINEEDFMGHLVDEESKLSAWARKERKFKCELCPSSFKRASHLSRHQLVHTGERPFACDRCDKAFSRHDKLKHHIHRAHELDSLNDALPPDSLYTIGHVQILTPEQTMIEMSEPINTKTDEEEEIFAKSESPSLNLNPSGFIQQQKKGRGRPRKHPIVAPPTVKRPRGRPRIRPIATSTLNKRPRILLHCKKEATPPLIKRPRGRPRIHPLSSREDSSGNFSSDIQFEDAEPPVDDDDMIIDSDNCPDIMEPVVEIKMEPQDKPPSEVETDSARFFENIGLFENTSAIGKIGECTISVASSNNTTLNRSST